MISKEEVNQKLKKMGYQVAEDSSVVTVLVPSQTSMKNTIKEIKHKLQEMDYSASFGVKQYKGEREDETLSQEEVAKTDDTQIESEETNPEEDDDMILKQDGEQFSLEDFGIGF